MKTICKLFFILLCGASFFFSCSKASTLSPEPDPIQGSPNLQLLTQAQVWIRILMLGIIVI